ncbi:uncharacterized protein IL334_002924 [Kwoniella shivajii]|uniref:Protein FRA10AC1 n=1 Tax=Kwoniella shivajii TaxID=564305 RepID=A0ABZ1CW35_9TREE|nr:hypothetical protein IL334_002924 [Kwoniella shivajii]
MSWKAAGQLVSGPPSSSLPSISSIPVGQRLRPNQSGLNAFQRESLLSIYGPDKDALSREEKNRKSDWDVVREHHRFIRDDEDPRNVSWEERVARAYESKLFKEFALIDLKHYKSHSFALRWRTAEEVINGIGESTCASLRCKYHKSPSDTNRSIDPSQLRFKDPDSSSIYTNTTTNARAYNRQSEEIEIQMPEMRSFELPFVYAEGGERKEALVKVRLCGKCQGKLMWKPSKKENDKDKEKGNGNGTRGPRHRDSDTDTDREDRRGKRGSKEKSPSRDVERRRRRKDRSTASPDDSEYVSSRRHTDTREKNHGNKRKGTYRSRSRSPSRKHHDHSRDRSN